MPLRPSRGKRRLRPQLEESSTPIWLTPRRSDASLARPYNPSKIFMPRTSLFSLLATLAAVLVVMAAPAQAEALRDMQRAWIAFRDATCTYEASQWSGGTGQGPAYEGCVMRMTAEQTLYLERQRGM